MSFEKNTIHFGKNGGYQALNLAVLFGSRRIILLGYDMKIAESGKKHWFGDHPGRMNRASPFEHFIEAFKTTLPDLERAGIEVINCTPGSALPWYAKKDLRDVL